jgi:hypothetical protein
MSISTEEEASQNDTTKNDLSESLLSFLEGSDHPRFTQEHEALERATMTDEERAAALSDLFGKQCALDAHQNKRARRDLDQDAIVFLVNQMRLEINRIPLDRKRALVEAQLKCHASEFSDARLERFLRCEGMNVKVCMEVCMCVIGDKRIQYSPPCAFASVNLSARSSAVCKVLGEPTGIVWTREVSLVHDVEWSIMR